MFVAVPLPNPHTDVIRAYGEFIECGADDELIVGTRIKGHDAAEKERRKTEPLKPWLKGQVQLEEDGSVTVMFNQMLLGWHYGWASTKHTCDALHCFKVSLFRVVPQSEDLEYLGSAQGPPFQIYSRRRQRGNVDPAAASTRKPENPRQLGNPLVGVQSQHPHGHLDSAKRLVSQSLDLEADGVAPNGLQHGDEDHDHGLPARSGMHESDHQHELHHPPREEHETSPEDTDQSHTHEASRPSKAARLD
mmetsp:Transcript_5741/g.10757  ORF Transcript_5741/g.10757 Transcript_5741/m.10757 type:complete len:248 (-) Transcript_5741:143-886(-)